MTEAIDQAATPWRRFVGANIKGTPAMSADKVGEDVETLRGTASIIVTQETRWRWYWTRIAKILGLLLRGGNRRHKAAGGGPRWKTSPTIPRAVARPVRAAQAVMWKGRHWRRARTIVRRLHAGAAKISETRYLRAVLLVDWDTQLAVWAGTTHFVVGGDARGDSPRRRGILLHDLDQLGGLLDDLVATGHPVIFQLDANIKDTSEREVFKRLTGIIERHGGRVYGELGVEWLIVVDGRDTKVEVRGKGGWTVKPKARGGRLNTDHEARGITFRLVRR